MDEAEILEREVMRHREAIAELVVSINGLESQMSRAAEPEKLARKAAALRLAVQGRTAAVELGAARLSVLVRFAGFEEEKAA